MGFRQARINPSHIDNFIFDKERQMKDSILANWWQIGQPLQKNFSNTIHANSNSQNLINTNINQSLRQKSRQNQRSEIMNKVKINGT